MAIGLSPSAPASEVTENHVAEILRLISDPVASAARLSELVQARKDAGEVLAAANEASAKASSAVAAADEASRKAEAEVEAAKATKQSVADEQAAFNELASGWKSRLRTREEAVTSREALVDRREKDASTLAAAAEKAKTQYESALANLRAAIPATE